MIKKAKLSRVAVVSLCNMLRLGVESLLDDELYQCQWVPKFSHVSDIKPHLLSDPPDVTVIAVQLYHCDMNALIDLVKLLKRFNPLMKIIVMLDFYIECVTHGLMSLGVQGVIQLTISVTEWQAFFNGVMKDEQHYPDCVQKNVVALSSGSYPFFVLNKNENRVLKYLLAGHSIATLAVLMSKTKKTVASQKASAMRKLGLTHYSQLIAVRGMLNV